jgi:hypothetical protein
MLRGVPLAAAAARAPAQRLERGVRRRALIEPDDLAPVVQVVGLRVSGGPRMVDGGDGAVLEQEAVADEIGVEVEADDLAAVVDPVGDVNAASGTSIFV